MYSFLMWSIFTLHSIQFKFTTAQNVGDKMARRSEKSNIEWRGETSSYCVPELESVWHSSAPTHWPRLGFTAAPLVGVYFVCVHVCVPAVDMLIRPCSSTQIRTGRPTRRALMRLPWVMLSDNRQADSRVTPASMTLETQETTSGPVEQGKESKSTQTYQRQNGT